MWKNIILIKLGITETNLLWYKWKSKILTQSNYLYIVRIASEITDWHNKWIHYWNYYTLILLSTLTENYYLNHLYYSYKHYQILNYYKYFSTITIKTIVNPVITTIKRINIGINKKKLCRHPVSDSHSKPVTPTLS